jgi:hypothetical protein
MESMENASSDAEIVQGITSPARAGAALTGTAVEAVASLRRSQHEQAAGNDAADSEEIARRIEALHAASTGEIEATMSEGWIDRSSPERIADLVQVADTWKDSDPRMEEARQQIDREVFERYGVRIGDHPDRASLIDAINNSEASDATADLRDSQAEVQRDEAGAHLARVDELESALADDQDDPAIDPDREADDEHELVRAQDEAGAAFDSSDRLHAEADRLRSQGADESTVQDRMLVEVSHNQPAGQAPLAGRAAVKRKSGKTAAKAKGVTKGHANVRQRGLSR